MVAGLLRAGLVVLAASALTAIAQPANDDCADAIVIGSLPFADSVDTTTATTEAGDPSCEGAELPTLPTPEPNSVWYTYTPGADVMLTASTAGSSKSEIAVTVAVGSCGSLAIVDCEPALGYGHERVEVPIRAGTTAYIEVMDMDFGGGGGTANLTVTEVPITAATPLHTGADFQANEIVDGYERHPDADAADDGDFVVVWRGYDLDGRAVRGRLFDASGAPTTSEFAVNASTTDDQVTPTVSMDAAGNFVVTWISPHVSGYQWDVFAQRFDPTGTPVGAEIPVNTYTTDDQSGPVVALHDSGDFVVVWNSETQDAGNPGLFGQRFDSAGSPVGSEFQVNTSPISGLDYPQRHSPAVAGAPSGGFVVTWENYDGVAARFYDGTGAALTGEVQVNQPADGADEPTVAIADDGRTLIAWGGDTPSQRAVKARVYTDSGTPLAPELVISDQAIAQAVGYAATDVNASGDFVVAWTDEIYGYGGTYTDAYGEGIRARRLNRDGTPLGDEFQANTYAVWAQQYPTVAMADADTFVVVWEDYTEYPGRDGFGNSIFGHAFDLPEVAFGCPPLRRLGCKTHTIDLLGRLIMKDRSPDTADTMKWKWIRGQATTFADFGDPVATDDYVLCVYDGADALLKETVVPAGGTCGSKPCWRTLSTKGVKYVDKAGTQGGVQKIVAKAGDQGKAKLIVKGKGATLAMPTLPPTLPVTVQVANTAGSCWEGRFGPAGVKTATAVKFDAKVTTIP